VTLRRSLPRSGNIFIEGIRWHVLAGFQVLTRYREDICDDAAACGIFVENGAVWCEFEFHFTKKCSKDFPDNGFCKYE